MTQSFATIDATLQQAYAWARRQLGSQDELAVLHLGAQHSGFALGRGPQPASMLGFDLGLERLAQRYFKTTPPSPLAMEHTIMVVEDVVMPLRAQLPRAARLVSGDPLLLQVAQLSLEATSADPHAPLVLSLQAMEHTFNRLVDVVEGRPATQEGLPVDASFVAALLVLRECMHHLHFDAVTLLQAPA